MAVVTIEVTSEAVIINPATININREDQTIIWKLQGGTWEPNGIVFNMDPPAPLVCWPGQPAAMNSHGDFEAVGLPLPDDVNTSQLYAYTINVRDMQNSPRTGVVSRVTPTLDNPNPEVVMLEDGTGVISIDPGIENQPVP